MNSKEKNAIIKKILDTEDDAILNQVREILELNESDFWNNLNPELKASIQKGLEQSEKGAGKPHEQVMKEIRSKYKA